MAEAVVTKDTIIADLLKINMGCVPILINEGMHCIGCPASQGETLEEACGVHGLDVNDMVSKLNDFLSKVED